MRLVHVIPVVFGVAGLVMSLVLLCLIVVPGLAQQPKQPKVELPKQVGGGRVVELPFDRLPRFKQPVTQPPKHQPPPKHGGNWHWHPQHAWMWFPMAQAPPTFIIPSTYRLPPRVHYYEQQGTYVTCPHCSQIILLE